MKNDSKGVKQMNVIGARRRINVIFDSPPTQSMFSLHLISVGIVHLQRKAKENVLKTVIHTIIIYNIYRGNE